MTTGKEFVDAYLKLTDIMFQALKARKYRIFEMTLSERRKILDEMDNMELIFAEYDAEQKSEWRSLIESYDKRIENEMIAFKSELDKDLSEVHASKVKLRARANVKNYYMKNYSNHGTFIDKLK